MTDADKCLVPSPCVDNPEYFDKDGDETWTGHADSTAGVVDDEGSYLTCGAAIGDYQDYSRAQMIAA